MFHSFLGHLPIALRFHKNQATGAPTAIASLPSDMGTVKKW
jgi:hypothetical protein